MYSNSGNKALNGGFVRGTPVHSVSGLLPIERLKPGDEVLSVDESGARVHRKITLCDSRREVKIYAIRYSMDDPNEINRQTDTIHLLYTSASNLVHTSGGLVEARSLHYQHLTLLDGAKNAEVQRAALVMRTPVADVGWLAVHDEEEPAYVVDFRAQCQFWKYPMWREEDVGVPYVGGLDFKVAGLFAAQEMWPIYDSSDRGLVSTLYNIEVEGGGGYFVGELGVWVAGREKAPAILDTPPEQASIYADAFIKTYARNYGKAPEYSASLLDALESTLAFYRLHTLPEEHVADKCLEMGCALGEFFVGQGYGNWVRREGTPLSDGANPSLVLRFGEASFFDPIGKVVRRAGLDDPEDLMKYFARMVVRLRAGVFVEDLHATRVRHKTPADLEMEKDDASIPRIAEADLPFSVPRDKLYMYANVAAWYRFIVPQIATWVANISDPMEKTTQAWRLKRELRRIAASLLTESTLAHF